jgi:electron transport complex protein RnfC
MALERLPSFRHGVHPDENKDATACLNIQRMPFVSRYWLPLGQHAGAPSKPVVQVGEAVQRGQMIAEAQGFVSTFLHAPVTGWVRAVGMLRHPAGHLVPGIELEADPYATQQLPDAPPVDWRSLSRGEFVEQVQRAGLVGLGGAAFPSHVKYAIPTDRQVEQLVINGCECEPYLTCDHRTMVEQADSIVRGIQIVATQLASRGTTIGVERNKPDAVDALRAAIDRARQRDPDHAVPIEVRAVRVKYPQGAEKMLIKALFDTEVPAGKLPLDIGMVVNNVGTMAGIAAWFDHGVPLIERVVTVSGPGVPQPSNLLVPIGTPVRAVLDHCGGLLAETRDVVMGGPMMGQPLSSLDVPVLKGTSGLLGLTETLSERTAREYNCVRCGRCLEACSNFLNPSRLARLAKAGRWEEMEQSFALDCMECGACSFACPSNIPIVHLIRAGKAVLREKKAAEKAEKERPKT